MISKFSTDKALLDKAQQVSDDNGYLLIPNGQAYEPDPNATYVQEYPMDGTIDGIGLADASSDFQLSIYQITVYTPKAEAGGRWAAVQIGEVYQAAFFRGLQLTYNSQMLRITNTTPEKIMENKNHFIQILSIGFSVIN